MNMMPEVDTYWLILAAGFTLEQLKLEARPFLLAALALTATLEW
jgi:hypothetical protein